MLGYPAAVLSVTLTAATRKEPPAGNSPLEQIPFRHAAELACPARTDASTLPCIAKIPIASVRTKPTHVTSPSGHGLPFRIRWQHVRCTRDS